MRRLIRFVAPAAAVAALALPQSQAQAVNTLAYSWVVHCNNTQPQATPLLELPKGTYAVTVAGACSFGVSTTHSIPVSTCVNPLQSLPCVDTGVQVNNVPGATCYVGGGVAYVQTCSPAGVYTPGCNGSFTVVVNEQCLIANQAGVIGHGGGAMTARVVDGGDGSDNVGAFVVTAVWTPL